MDRRSAEAVINLAHKAGVQLEFKGSYVREVGSDKWLNRQRMYNRLYWRLTKKANKPC